MSWDSYHRYADGDRWDAIVVGSGIGGLTAAALLAKKARKRVLVLERHYEAGGFTHTFRRKGYEWDVGVHYIGDVGREDAPTRRLFDEVTGARLQWAPMPDVYDRVFIGDRSYDFVTGRQRFVERLKEYFPTRTAAIDAYMQRLREAISATTAAFAEKVVPAPIAALFGSRMRRAFMKLASRTTADVLSEITDDAELTAVLTAQWGDYGLPPSQSSFAIHAMVANHYRNGGFYPVGGASSIARGAVSEIEAHGGRVLVSADVAAIELEGRRVAGVRMADGRRFRAPLVISNAGLAITFGRLLPANERTAGLRDAASRIGHSAAHLALYLGLNATDEELGLDGTNLWIYRDADHDGNFARHLADPREPLPLVYVSFPSAKDPSWSERLPGLATIDVITLAPYEAFQRWEDSEWKRRGADYERAKQELADRALQVLFAHRPQVREHVVVREVSSPLSTRHFTGNPHGEIYGLAHTPARFAERGLKPRTPVRGLYLTGQDISTCGVAGGLFGGALTASAIVGRPLLPR